MLCFPDMSLTHAFETNKSIQKEELNFNTLAVTCAKLKQALK